MFAAIQYKPPKGNPRVARAELSALIEEAARKGSKIIVCPEMATTGYIWQDRESILPFAEPANGPTFTKLAPIAQKYKCWIVCGYVEKENEFLYNSALVIDPTGALTCSYRKILLYDADYTWAKSGSTRYLIETEYGIMTPAICMDLNDIALIRFLHNRKPNILAFCTNWLDEGTLVLDYWQNCLFMWKGWFLAANSWGPDENISFCGQSVILNPQHEPVVQAPKTGNQILYSSVK